MQHIIELSGDEALRSCLHASKAKEIRQWNCLHSFLKHLHFSKSDIAFIRFLFSARISELHHETKKSLSPFPKMRFVDVSNVLIRLT